jgi:signal transduction histidine kinase
MVSPNPNVVLSPSCQGAGESGPEFEAQKALLGRPRLTIRLRIVAVFTVLFALMAAITVAAVVFVIEVRAKQAFLEKVNNYAFEVQQARRFEKNYFLYRTNLSDAVASVHTARALLDRNADQLRTVVGVEELEQMHARLTAYEEPLEELLATAAEGGEGHGARSMTELEARLRTHGAQIMADAAEMIDRERLAMHQLLHMSLVISVAFLVLMTFVLVLVVRQITGLVVQPLGRFTHYAARVGAGDYSPITPARKYRDEFCDLAVAFNQMLCEIKVRQNQLSQSAKMAAVGSLTSGIAHELNNPLNNIALTVETLIEDFEELSAEEKLHMLNQAYGQVERASFTVRDLLDFTREEVPVLVSVSVNEIVESTLKLVANEISLSQVELELRLEDDLPEVTGNPGNLQQVFLNLMINGIHAMPDGGRLVIATRRDDGWVRVDVEDTGQGIPPDNLGRIFEPFFTTKEVGKGTGLGLFVSHGIVAKHQGRLTVDSEVGRGTTFSVFLPIKKKDEETS